MKDLTTEQTSFEFEELKTIKGYPELRWTGKRPYTSTQYYPAQLKEVYGQPDQDGWMNKIFWGDNLQVMSHMLKEFRGKIDLIYIDPPFDSKADYKKKITLKELNVESDSNTFEQKQYSDIWTNDEYLQFMFERLILLRELLSETGQLFLHCDWHKSHLLRILLDEVFGSKNFRNEIIWCYTGVTPSPRSFQQKHDTILRYSKSDVFVFNPQFIPYKGLHATKKISHGSTKEANPEEIMRLLERGKAVEDWWVDIFTTDRVRKEMVNYPTQKPKALLERIIKSSSNPGDLVFDCFMGSGTTQIVSLELGRKFIGADINLVSIQTTTKRLSHYIKQDLTKTIGFEVFNVNNYEMFNNPVEAKDILINALDIQKYLNNKLFDGELDGRNIKIMPINRIASRVDLNELIANLPYDFYRKKQEESPNAPVDQITLICMGHEPDLLSEFKKQTSTYKIDIEILDILTDKKDLEFKREAQADVKVVDNRLIIQSFYPMNLLQKLSIQQDTVDDYKQLVESVMIDWNYDGVVLRPSVLDIPNKNTLVEGAYILPEKTGRIRIKITDLISESLELEVTKNG
jgi:DNA modification methylase